VGLDLPYLGGASHDSRLKVRDIEEVEDRKRVSSAIYRERDLL